MCWVEARDDAEHPTMDGTALTTKNPAQDVNDAEVEKSRITTLIFLFLEKSKAFPLALLSPWKAYPLDPTAAWSLSSPLLKFHPSEGLQCTPIPVPTPQLPIPVRLYYISLFAFLHAIFYLLLSCHLYFYCGKNHACHISICSKSEYILVYIYVYSHSYLGLFS